MTAGEPRRGLVRSAAAAIRRQALAAITHDAVHPVTAPLVRDVASVFMMHRFDDPAAGSPGHDIATLRANLAFLRRRGYVLESIGALVDRLRAGRPPQPRTVVFTVDDGYADFARVALPVFAEFDCPVTVFLTTDFVEGRSWGWWDKLDWALLNSPRATTTFPLSTGEVPVTLGTRAERRGTGHRLAERLKRVPHAERTAIVEALPTLLDVAVPERCPPEYAFMTWDDVRGCVPHGVTYGPHTVTHPILQHLDAAAAEREMRDSWTRLCAETEAAVPVFCYPYGTRYDFDAREQAVARAMGCTAAVSAVNGYVELRDFAGDGESSYRLGRFAYHDDRPSFVKVVTGLERVHVALRRLIAS